MTGNHHQGERRVQPPARSVARGAAGRGGANAPERQDAARNRLLRALPSAEYDRLRPLLEPVEIEVLEVLAEAGEPLRFVYFPEAAIVSVVRRLRDGTIAEAGTIGREGLAGFTVVLGDAWSPATLLGQIPGPCLRFPFDTLSGLLPDLPALTGLLQRFALSFLDQVEQTGACNSVHIIEQRCARWLLMTHDRVDGDQFFLTHEVLAQMLGVRRAGVTEAASALRRAGLVEYSRGRVTVLDRAGLEAAACECYEVVRGNLEHLLGPDAVGD